MPSLRTIIKVNVRAVGDEQLDEIGVAITGCLNQHCVSRSFKWGTPMMFL
ncbi:MAG: hypothetical protein ACYCPQ_03800 [Elusimicrobiota bacterium]